MSAGRLAWRTPTGAMLWEIWSRYKMSFLWQGIALAMCAFFGHWNEHGVSKGVGEILVMVSLLCFLGAYLHFLICFGYIEFDARKGQIGFPERLLLKPVSTTRLILVPMVFGGAAIVAIIAIWTELVLRHLLVPPASPAFSPFWTMLWIGTVLVSLFWWMQTLAWSLPLFKGRVPVVLAVAMTHLLVLILPGLIWIFAPDWIGEPGWRWLWGIPAALLLSAVPAAWIGLKLMRQGSWESPSRISQFWSRRRLVRTRGRRQKFGSAFRAQFWFEWRRQGLVLPVISGWITLLIYPCFFLALKWFAHWLGNDTNPPGLFLFPVWVTPIFLSILLSPALAVFDPLQTKGELPVYIAVRPLANDSFVLAKLAMALATSALTSVITVASTCLWLVLLGKEALFSKAGLVTPYGPVDCLTWCVPALLLMILWIWKNLVAGIGAGLTGRTPWLVVASVYWRLVFLIGLVVLVDNARTNVNFRGALLHWLPGILIACLAVKIAASIAAFAWGLRRNAITARAISWIVGSWLVCGLSVAGCASHVCNAIHQPGLRIWAALGGFLLLPLADLALAPLALAWNRHR